jgi:hypothetical protein
MYGRVCPPSRCNNVVIFASFSSLESPRLGEDLVASPLIFFFPNCRHWLPVDPDRSLAWPTNMDWRSAVVRRCVAVGLLPDTFKSLFCSLHDSMLILLLPVRHNTNLIGVEPSGTSPKLTLTPPRVCTAADPRTRLRCADAASFPIHAFQNAYSSIATFFENNQLSAR